MPFDYDLVIIGSGTTGQSVAFAARKKGWSVAMIERHRFGGTCPNDGCDAKKPFVNAAAAVDQTRRLGERGVTADPVVDWESAARWSARFSEPIDANTRERLQDEGIEAISAAARFVGAREVQAGDRKLSASKILIATGSRPRPLTIDGSDLAITSTDLMAMTDVPQRIAFIGGGFISFEFAHALVRSKREVTILHGNDTPLAGFDQDLVRGLLDSSRDVGLDIRTDTRVEAIERRGDHFVVRTSGQASVDADFVVHGAGRVPNIDSLDLDAAGIHSSDDGVEIDEFGRCVGNEHIYAGGDVADTSHPRLLQVAVHHARVIRSHLLDEDGPRISDKHPVSVLFTTPELAGVGLTEVDARATGRSIDVHNGPDGKLWKIHRQLHQDTLRFKTILDRDTGAILGAWVLGAGAGDLINLVALAMENDLTPDDLREPLYGYPTISGHVGSLFG